MPWTSSPSPLPSFPGRQPSQRQRVGGSPAAGRATYPLLWIVFIAQPLEMAPVAARCSSRPAGMEADARATQHEPETRATQAHPPEFASRSAWARLSQSEEDPAPPDQERLPFSGLGSRAAELIVQSIDPRGGPSYEQRERSGRRYARMAFSPPFGASRMSKSAVFAVGVFIQALGAVH